MGPVCFTKMVQRLDLNKISIYGNIATQNGGGLILASGSSPHINNCTIVNNIAQGGVLNANAGGIGSHNGSNPTIIITLLFMIIRRIR